MKKINGLILLTPILLSISLSGCDKNDVHFNKIDEIEEGTGIFEVKYDNVDHDAGDKFWADNNDNWDNGGCTAVTKQLSNGHRVVGRNMDLNIADKAAYLVRTEANEAEGIYKTMGLAYTFREYAPYLGEVREKGITDEFRDILPFLCDDVMNDQGLHIEVNMRHGEVDFGGNDQFSLQGTNPGKRRVHMFELPRYIGERCKTVKEAKEYINELDIYSKYGYWNYCFIISDSVEYDGAPTHASLLEFSEIGYLGETWNDLVDAGELPGEPKVKAINWIDDTPETLAKLDYIGIGPTNMEQDYKINALAQANFYLNWWAYQRQDMKSGQGRFFAIQSLINTVDSLPDLFNLMRRISYSWFYHDFDECNTYHFDPRSENLGEFQGATYDFIFAPANQDAIKELFNASNKPVFEMTRKEKEEAGGIWESTFTEAVDVTNQTFDVRFFENEDLIYHITFDGIEKNTSMEAPTEWSPLPALEPINH